MSILIFLASISIVIHKCCIFFMKKVFSWKLEGMTQLVLGAWLTFIACLISPAHYIPCTTFQKKIKTK